MNKRQYKKTQQRQLMLHKDKDKEKQFCGLTYTQVPFLLAHAFFMKKKNLLYSRKKIGEAIRHCKKCPNCHNQAIHITLYCECLLCTLKGKNLGYFVDCGYLIKRKNEDNALMAFLNFAGTQQFVRGVKNGR